MPTIVKSVCIATLLSAVTACSKLGVGQDGMTWAREALSRNERLEVVATDPQAKTFTVRLKDTGDLQVIRVDQLSAGPAAATGPAAAQGASAGATQTVATGQPSSPAAQTASNQAPPGGSSASLARGAPPAQPRPDPSESQPLGQTLSAAP